MNNETNNDIKSILLIWHNQLGKPSSLIGIAADYHTLDKLILSHMTENYSAHTPRLIALGNIYKVGIDNVSDRVLEEVHYYTEIAILNTRRV